MIADVDRLHDARIVGVVLALVIACIALNLIGWAFFRRPGISIAHGGNWGWPRWRDLDKYLYRTGVILVVGSKVAAILTFVVGALAQIFHDLQ
jgi:uncharacterized membrane protein